MSAAPTAFGVACVRNDVVQREAVVAGDLVDALERPVAVLAVVGEEIVAAVKPAHERPDESCVALHETAGSRS